MHGSSISIAVMCGAIFLLYTNLPVVAAQNGLIPGAAGAVLVLLLFAAVQLGCSLWCDPGGDRGISA